MSDPNQLYDITIEAAEGFNDLTIICRAPACVSDVNLYCGSKVDQHCIVQKGAVSYNDCGSSSPSGKTCEMIELSQETTTPTSNPSNNPSSVPTTEPTHNPPITADPTLSNPAQTISAPPTESGVFSSLAFLYRFV